MVNKIGSGQLVDQKISRRKVIGLLGFGIIASQFPLACGPGSSKLSDSDKQSLHYLTLTEVAELIKSKKISSETLTQLMLNRISHLDRLNSYNTVMRESALAAARALDRELDEGKYRGPLHGVPIGIKDLLYTTNAPTTMGHSFNSNFMAPYNATVVDKLHDAGAVILGKLNQTEGAMGGYSDNFKIPINPWSEDLWTGLSSSGSGVATAAGLCFASLGSDTGGSIRFPAAANGIVGLKPTYGLVSKYGAMPLSTSLDHIGPMTRSIKDAAILLHTIVGYDPNDSVSLKQVDVFAGATLTEGVKGLRIGVDHEYISADVDPKLAASIEAAVTKLEELGMTVVPFKMPRNKKERADAFWFIAGKEAAMANKETFPSRKEEYGNFFRDFLEAGNTVTDEQYKWALQFKEDFKTQFIKQLSEVAAFISPVCGVAKGVTEKMWRAGMQGCVPTVFADDLDLDFCNPADLAGIPALAMPCGKAENGFPPPSMQFMGVPLSEGTLLRIGYAYEEATSWHKQHPAI
jgi:amidase